MGQEGKRSRSFGGCVTCRSRRMKCDEGKPTCSMCRLSKVACGGYDKSLIFASDEVGEAGTVRFRRPLLGDQERRRMCEWLTSIVPPHLALWHITGLDDQCEESSTAQDIQLNRGPFGVFRFGRPAQSLNTPAELDLPETETHVDPDGNTQLPQLGDNECLPPDISFLNPSEEQEFDKEIFGQSANTASEGQLVVSPGSSLWNLEMANNMRFQELFSDSSLPEYTIFPMTSPSMQDYRLPSSVLDMQMGSSAVVPDLISVPQGISTPVPDDAVQLLKHYSTTVLATFTPFQHSKTPWHVLFLPHSKNTLAALTMGETVDHASLCAFYGTLAMSAMSLGKVSGAEKWLNKATEYGNLATQQSGIMLETAYNVPKTAKYKSMLIALLTMLQISLVTSNRDKTEHYFLETEKLIRLKGLNRRKSRKVRLLHHCYAFERVLYETTHTGGSISSRRLNLRKTIESSEAAPYSRDSLSFRLSDWDNLDQEMLRVKKKDEGENDLHLQLPGVWDATLYPEIFGIPEIHLFLLSLVIRLGQEKELAESNDGRLGTGAGPLSLMEFMRRAKSIERCISRLERLGQTAEATRPPVTNTKASQNMLDSLVSAMQQAVTIYFYRRVYDVDPSLLQQKVVAVRDCLLRFESADDGMGYGLSRFIWPAFIAACEAQDPAVRVSFSTWFKESARRSGFSLFMDKLSDIERAWGPRLNTNVLAAEWADRRHDGEQGDMPFSSVTEVH